MKYNCPNCGTETYKSNLCNPRPLHRIRRPVEIELLDTIADKDARIAELKKEREEARKDAKIASHIANEYIEMYCDRICAIPFEICNNERVTVDRIMEKYK